MPDPVEPFSPRLSILLAADARLAEVRYADDQIWELTTGSGNPPALAVQTTYGLRASAVRIFPSFLQSGEPAHIDPARFSSSPVLEDVYPDYCRVRCSPFQGLDVLTEYRVPQSWMLAGRLRMANTGFSPLAFQFQLIALLKPQNEGQPFLPIPGLATTVLAGQAGNLAPVLFLTGGPDALEEPEPALSLAVALAPGEFRQLSWALASLATQPESLEAARRFTARPWEADLSRVEMINRRDRVEVQTGNPALDRVFIRAQDAAFRLQISAQGSLPAASTVAARLPEHGFSRQGSGGDYGPLWNGQTAFQALSLARFFLPASPLTVQGWVRNHLSVQNASGRTDWKPGIAGQLGRLHAQPVLAELAWRASLEGQDTAFLSGVYPGLTRYLETWLDSRHDRDGDGFPEWDHPYQAGLEDAPLFERWQPGGAAGDLRMVETPALGSFLCNEYSRLAEMATLLGANESARAFSDASERLAAQVQSTWDEELGAYRCRDRDAHLTWPGAIFASGSPGLLPLPVTFPGPRRLLLRLLPHPIDSARSLRVVLHGTGPTGESGEEIARLDWHWSAVGGQALSSAIYTTLTGLEVEGAHPGDIFSVGTPNLGAEELSDYLPLWAGIPGSEQATRMSANLVERYATPAGFASLPAPLESHVSFFWNSLIVEGLLRCGLGDAALDLVTRMLNGAASAIEIGGALGRLYTSAGLPVGEAGHCDGLPAPELFLEALGLHLVAPERILVRGNVLSELPVVVKYRGSKIERQSSGVDITFPGGQSARVEGPGNHWITQVRGVNPA